MFVESLQLRHIRSIRKLQYAVKNVKKFTEHHKITKNTCRKELTNLFRMPKDC